MRKGLKKLISGILLLSGFSKLYADDKLNVTQLETLREKGMISQEDYDILMAELNGTLKNEQLYKLEVNGVLLDNKFKALIRGDQLYFPLFKFLDILSFFNVKHTQDGVQVYLKEGVDFNLNTVKGTIYSQNNKELNDKLKKLTDYIIKEKDEYFLRSDIFKDIFLSSLMAEKNDSTIRMRLGFNTPEEAAILFKVRQEEILKELEKNEIVYMNKRKFFELGNARVQLFGNYSNQTDKEFDWEGNLEYQGVFLYGNLTTGYDFKKNELGNVELKYDDLFANHDLTLGAYRAGDDKNVFGDRVFGFTLRKDTGHYELGKRFIISETVPIGSKVELIYMRFPIEVQDAENGKVTFDNPMIRSDRSYQLKIYAPNGDVETRYINTAQNYNQQNKGEIEYDISFREDYDSKRYNWNANVYYGLTNELTVGVGSKRAPEKRGDDYKFLDEGRIELTYTNRVYSNQFPVTLKVGNDRTYTSGEGTNGRKYSERYKYDGLAQLSLGNWMFKTEMKSTEDIMMN